MTVGSLAVRVLLAELLAAISMYRLGDKKMKDPSPMVIPRW